MEDRISMDDDTPAFDKCARQAGQPMTFKPKTFSEAKALFKPLKRGQIARSANQGSKDADKPRKTSLAKCGRTRRPVNKIGPRAREWRRVWQWLKPRLEAAQRTQCEFDWIPHNCFGPLDPAHSKKRREMVGNDIYAVAIACRNIHQVLDEQYTHAAMKKAVMFAIERSGGLILP